MESKISASFGTGSSIVTHVNGFEIVSDVPVKVGGGGTAPSPFDLFLASLGACAAAFGRKFCDMHGVDGRTLGVDIACEWDEKDLVKAMTFNLTLPNGFPEELRAPLVRTVEGCIVKKQVMAPPEFTIELIG